MVCLIQGKLSIITGSAQGLGKAFAVRLLAAGAKVVATIIAIVFMVIGSWSLGSWSSSASLQYTVTVSVCVLSTGFVIIINILTKINIIIITKIIINILTKIMTTGLSVRHQQRGG